MKGIVFQHDSVEKCRREFSRNGQLREMCGFEGQVPPSWAYTQFLKKLIEHEAMVDELFESLVNQLSEVLPKFGQHLAIDSKETYSGVHKDGTPRQKMVKWFGYQLHLVVDATYELPVTFKVTKASASDITEGHAVLKQMKEKQPMLWDERGIKPVIDIRNMWKDPDKTRLLGGRENAVYDYKGAVSCVCLETGKQREMCNGGFEKDRQTQKKLCLAKQMGVACVGQAQCPIAQGIRIPLSEDRRIFTPIDRASYKWEKE